jgi:hypothetical protein
MEAEPVALLATFVRLKEERQHIGFTNGKWKLSQWVLGASMYPTVNHDPFSSVIFMARWHKVAHEEESMCQCYERRTMTLVDLPGMTKVPVGDQPSNIEARVRELVSVS